MSASAVSITAANPGGATRRRAVEKKANSLDLTSADPTTNPNVNSPTNTTATNNAASLTAGDITLRDLAQSIRAETRDPVLTKKPITTSNNPTPSSRRPSASRKPVPSSSSSSKQKPLWLTIISIFTKNLLLLLVLIGLVQLIRRLATGPAVTTTDGISVISGDLDVKIAEMESFLKKTTRMMQVQVEVIDKKLDKEIKGVKEEFHNEIDRRTAEIETRLREMDGKGELFEKFMDEMRGKNLLSRVELDELIQKASAGGDKGGLSLDEVREYARDIVEREIERHAADGLGRVDYALASGGGMVVRHSDHYVAGKGGSWTSLGNKNRGVHVESERMLRPSFGEPGQCFPFKGSSGFVVIRLRTAIIPEAVTLEHVSKAVAYDRSSAPKHCRVFGWLQGQETTDIAADVEKMLLLQEFSYDLEKSNAQTFSVSDSASSSIVDTIRLDFTSNHGSSSHTCIYRLRVHGHEPNSVSMLAKQS